MNVLSLLTFGLIGQNLIYVPRAGAAMRVRFSSPAAFRVRIHGGSNG